MSARTCAYRDCEADLDVLEKHATAKFCSSDHKHAEEAAKKSDVRDGFWGRFGTKLRQRPAVRA